MKTVIHTTSDEELLAAYAQNRNPEYLGTLYERYMAMVYGVALKYLKNDEDAQDAVMQMFEMLLVKAGGNEIEVFKAWLYACVRNFCLTELRKRYKNPSISSADEILEICDDFDPDELRKEDTKEKVLLKCVDCLPERQRIVILRFYIEERSYREIEDATGFSWKLVKSLIQNGRRNLKLCLESKGIG